MIEWGPNGLPWDLPRACAHLNDSLLTTKDFLIKGLFVLLVSLKHLQALIKTMILYSYDRGFLPKDLVSKTLSPVEVTKHERGKKGRKPPD